MQIDHATLLEEITALLGAKTDAAGLATVEETLTAGYARALALEGERWRLERRMGELARELDGNVEARAGELAELAQVVSKTDGELRQLRTLLVSLRERARELRTATAGS